MLNWIPKHPEARFEMLGYIPQFLDERDPRCAKDQINANYQGGWSPMQGFEMREHGIKYHGDPLTPLLFETHLRNETIRFYDCAWVAIIQPDGSFEISRLD